MLKNATLSLLAILAIFSLFHHVAFAATCKNTKVSASYSLVPNASDIDKQNLCKIALRRPKTFTHFNSQNFAFVLQNTNNFREIGDDSGEATLLSIIFITSGFGRDATDLKNILSLQKKTDGCMTIEALAKDMTASLQQDASFQPMIRDWEHDAFLKYALMVMYQNHPECHVHE